MNYVTAIKTAIFVFPIIAFLFTIPFILHQYHKYGSINRYRALIIYSFILYLIVIYFLVILPLPNIKDVSIPKGRTMNLVPFAFVSDFLTNSSFLFNDSSTYLKAFSEPSFYVAAFNILMTIPFGMYLRYYFKCSFKKVFLCGFLLSLFFELTQLTGLYFIYPYPYRLFDVDDLILNTFGSLLGYLLFGIIKGILPTREQIDKISLEKGKSVSGFRRLTSFCLDILICLVLYVGISLVFNNKFLKYILLFTYFVIIPYFYNGKTLGSSFLKLRLEFPNKTFLRLSLRLVFLYFYYFFFNYFILTFGFSLINYFNLEKELYLVLLLIFISMLFYFINIFYLIVKNKLFYDRLFKTKYISTILEDEKDTETNEF